MPVTKPTYFLLGAWNCFCQRCNKKVKNSEITREWTGLLVCRACFTQRQSQDFVTGVPDQMAPPWAAPESPDVFVVAPPPGFTASTMITGSLAAPLLSGPEELFDTVNTLSVSTNFPMLPYVSTDDAILAGANMVAIYNSASAAWEIAQFENVAAGSSGAWDLTGLLRGRVGAENAMAQTAPAGSAFYYLGQSSAPLYDWINNNLFAGNVGLANVPFSPCDITFDGTIISWTRRSKAIRLDQPDIDPVIDSPPLGEDDERYSVDILDGSGSVVATLNTIGRTFVNFTIAEQFSVLGSFGSAYTVRIYQVSRQYGRGSYRQAVAPASLRSA